MKKLILLLALTVCLTACKRYWHDPYRHPHPQPPHPAPPPYGAPLDGRHDRNPDRHDRRDHDDRKDRYDGVNRVKDSDRDQKDRYPDWRR